MNLSYLRLELKRMARNKRVLIFGLVMPSVMVVFLGHAYGDADINGVPATAYVMISMAILGVMANALGGGGSIAVERALGWNRQLRLTPLRPIAYLLTKVGVALLVALGPLLLTFVIGRTVLHVDLSAGVWAQAGVLVLFSALPFAALGVALGYLVKAESIQQMTSLVSMGLGLLGGIWFPIVGGFMKTVAEFTPTYWAGQVARGPLYHGHPSAQALLVLVGWTALFGYVAFYRFQRSTARV